MGQSDRVQRVPLPTGVTLVCASAGRPDGVPVLLLHAWGESRRAFDRVVPSLPDTFHSFAVDQRGHGDAEAPPSGYSLTDLAGDVVALLDVLGLPSAVLVGSSSGGYVAQQVAVAWPHRVSGLVLVGSPRSLRGRPPFADEVDRLIDPVDPGWVRRSLAWFPLHHHVPDSYVEARVRDGARVPAHVWRQTFDGLCAAEPPTDTGVISCPTLVIAGEHDDLLGLEQERALAEAIPGARLLVYQDTGHLVLWEQPERLVRDLAAFVRDL